MRGEDLTPYLLRLGYTRAVFPMTMENGEVEWFQPYQRCLFPIEGVHVSRSLAREIRRERFVIRFDTAFEQVMRGCLRPEDNWISEHFIRVYSQVHAEGWAHCSECWIDDRLVGGVYGIAIGGCFCAESMFHRESNASKVALWALVNRCRELGFTLFDAQVMNRHLASLGAYQLSHRRYSEALRAALLVSTPWSVTSS